MATSPTTSTRTSCGCPDAPIRVLDTADASDMCHLHALALVGSAGDDVTVTVVVGGPSDPQVCPGCAHWKQTGQACGKCGRA